jgi:hypothetical protein
VSIGFIKKATGRDVPVDDTDNPLPVTLVSGGTDQDVNLVQVAGTAVSVDNGAADAGTTRVAVAPNTAASPFNVTGAVQPLVTSLDWTATGDVQNGALTDTMKTAAGVDLYNTLNWLTISAGTIGAAATLSVKDGASGTVKWQLRIQTAGVTHHFLFNPPISSTANTLLEIATTDPTSGAIYWSAGGTVVG